MPKCDFNKFIEIALRHGCSPVNLLHIFRAPFPRNISGWLLLYNWPDTSVSLYGCKKFALFLLLCKPHMQEQHNIHVCSINNDINIIKRMLRNSSF